MAKFNEMAGRQPAEFAVVRPDARQARFPAPVPHGQRRDLVGCNQTMDLLAVLLANQDETIDLMLEQCSDDQCLVLEVVTVRRNQQRVLERVECRGELLDEFRKNRVVDSWNNQPHGPAEPTVETACSAVSHIPQLLRRSHDAVPRLVANQLRMIEVPRHGRRRDFGLRRHVENAGLTQPSFSLHHGYRD